MHSTTGLLKVPNTPRPMIMLTKQSAADRNGILLMGSMTGELAQGGNGRTEGRTRRVLLLAYNACRRNMDDGVMTAPIPITVVCAPGCLGIVLVSGLGIHIRSPIYGTTLQEAVTHK
jgi:hypothetical protein